MHTYIYTYMYIHMYTYIYIYIYRNIYIYILKGSLRGLRSMNCQMSFLKDTSNNRALMQTNLPLLVANTLFQGPLAKIVCQI